MSRFGTTDYSASNSNNNSSTDYKDRDSFLLGRYAIMEATLDRVGVYDGNYGQNLILNLDDVEVVEGVVSRRLDDEKLKVFGWDKWFPRNEETMELEPLPGQDEVSKESLPDVESTEAGGDTYRYHIEEGVMEGRDEPVDVGDLELWINNGKKTRTMAKVLSEKGHDIVDSENEREDYGWMNASNDSEFALRDELEGRRIMFWFESKTIPADEIDDDEVEEDITYTDAVVLDADTEAGITINNDNSDSFDADTSDSDSDDSSDSDESDNDALSPNFPSEVEELVEMFARTGQDNRESVASMVEDAAPDGYDLNMDAVMTAIENRS